MKPAEIRELTNQELVKNLEDTRRELLNLRLRASGGQVENTARIRQVRRDVARLLTEQRRRQMAAAASAPAKEVAS